MNRAVPPHMGAVCMAVRDENAARGLSRAALQIAADVTWQEGGAVNLLRCFVNVRLRIPALR